jgi:nicotinamidase-related amidase
MKRALLLVDYIHDFVDDDGALTVGPPAQAIRENIERAISRMGKSDLIVSAHDSHNWDAPHPEKKLFPPHALTGTRGADTAVPEALKNAVAPSITIRKTRYSAFHRTGLADILRAAGVDRLYLAGVCTDICVLHTAIAAYNAGFDTAVLSDCVASFNAAGHDFAMAHFTNVLGFETVTSREL